ncbi:MAG: conjugal transfer protein TrbI, partial [Pseudomonadota bacterium]|nr:conjugal transfer protein TrbI [Pseudomonadota bacterium]
MNGSPSTPSEAAGRRAPPDDPRAEPDEAALYLPPKVDPETLVLRGSPARAIRFKRGLIVSLMGASAASVAAITWFALEPNAIHLVADGDDQLTLAKSPSDTLSGLPSSYGSVPKLGPPLPGDLGRPILERQQQLAGAMMIPTKSSMPPNQVPTADEARQRQVAELKAARESGLLVPSTAHDPGVAPLSLAMPTQAIAASADKLAIDPDRDANGQQRKADFLRLTGSKGDINLHALTLSPSPYTISAGAIIAASLITGLRSDLPGLVTAQVTERVFDSATGRILLIPQGARLLGSYDSVVNYGQRRALVVWQRLIYPDGSSIALD